MAAPRLAWDLEMPFDTGVHSPINRAEILCQTLRNHLRQTLELNSLDRRVLFGGFWEGVARFWCFVVAAAFFMYVGAYGPETSVYPGDKVPSRFTDTMKEVGALEEGEEILFFYSDGFTDILDGFYFVSDQRVVIYSPLAPGEPLTSISFDEIAELEIYRDESFLSDSEITLTLDNGEYVFVPVSSELGRDRKFFDAIIKRAPDAIVNE